jgi:hypothetical protein
VKRKYSSSKLYVFQTIGGVSLLIPYVSDLDDEQLKTHYDNAVHKEDYEYTEVCFAELKNRGIK